MRRQIHLYRKRHQKLYRLYAAPLQKQLRLYHARFDDLVQMMRENHLTPSIGDGKANCPLNKKE